MSRTHSPSWLYPITAPLAALYGAIVNFRNGAYDRGTFNVHSAEIPVVSIGGITAGGAAKTPLTIWTLAALLQAGAKPGMLSRGYSRRGNDPVWVSRGDGSPILNVQTAGDEPHLIASLLPTVPVHCDRDRVRGAKALREAGCNVVVLDDGFQHRRLKRNLDWVSLDTSLPPAAYRMLPLGFLRENFTALANRASAIWVKVETPEFGDKWQSELRNLGVSVPVVPFRLTAKVWRNQNQTLELSSFRGKRVVAFAGIAHPVRFKNTLQQLDVEIVRWYPYRDHYWFTSSDIADWKRTLQTEHADCIVTTEKDFHRLPVDVIDDTFFSLHIEVEPLVDTTPLLEQLRGLAWV